MPAIGEKLSHYEIVSTIGQGGMGAVYLAWDTSLERHVALKFLLPGLEQDGVARQRFLREARSAATLDHPHICVVHEVTDVEGTPFIVMEYIDGESLRQRLSRGRLSLEEVLHLGTEIAEALAEAHSKQIVHRDLKPANVMIARTGHVKVMDFGLAKRTLSAPDETTREQTLSALTHPGTTIGTLAYMAPEQLAGRPADHRSDIFSFGIVLREMLTGIHPFKRDTGTSTAGAILHEEPAPLLPRALKVPRRLASLIAAMLAKTPDERPRSMHQVRDDLQRMLADERSRADRARVHPVAFRTAQAIRSGLVSPLVAAPAVAVLAGVVFGGVRFFDHRADVRWARTEALPEIERLIGNNDVWRNLSDAYTLAEKAEAYVPDDPRLAKLLSQCSVRINIRTTPPGAKISMKDYMAPESEWTYLGLSPLENVRLPIGVFRWKIEKEGYDAVLAAASTWNPELAADRVVVVPYDLVRKLDRAGGTPPGMVRVAGEETSAGRLEDFFIDGTEVTNRQYRAFMDGGGYSNHEFWKHEFVDEGRRLTWGQALARFVDQSGQPGPATWQGGDYAEGQGDYPVSGVSWYEAAAFAEFTGKHLPTGLHWGLASGETTPLLRFPHGVAVFAPFSNFNGRAPVAAGRLAGITAYGVSDMAGNVREWCWNEAPKGRLVRGGAWFDNAYMFGALSQASPFDRSPQNGFRCARYPDPAKVPAAALQAVTFAEPRDVSLERPVSDDVFQVYKDQFSYDRTALEARVESRQENSGGWILEKVTFDAAYGGERVAAYLFLPQNTTPPLQVVLYFPGSASEWLRSSQNIESYYEFNMFLSFIVKSGRAVVYPIYKGTFERGSDSITAVIDGDRMSYRYAEVLIQEVKDLRRCLDYLESRPDIDRERIAYYGMSWGGMLGAVIPAVEKRFRASVLLGGGFKPRQRPEVDQLNYVTRVNTPTLMLNGKYDTLFDAETSSKPMFALLGTPADHKRQKLYDTDHIPPRNEFIKETLAWLDRYLGPVKR